MISKSLVVAKTNFRNIKLAKVITAIVLGSVLVQDIVFLILDRAGVFSNAEGNMTVSIGNYLFLLIILGAVYIPTLNFRKMINLGAKRTDFFYGCLATYVIMAAAVSLLCVVLFYTYDSYVTSTFYRGGTMDVLYWFGWLNNGPAVAFFRLFVFLLLLASAIHTLAAAQDKWYGWATDILIIAIISVFTPIAPLRAALVWFFNLIIFNPNAFLQITACLILAAAVYSLNKFIFARKII
jgi:hypothetical protein